MAETLEVESQRVGCAPGLVQALICPECRQEVRLDETRVRVVQGRPQIQCAACYREGSRRLKRRRNRRREKDRHQAAREVQSVEVLKTRFDAVHVLELNEALMQRAGGVRRFATLWWNQLLLAAARNPGGKIVLDAFRSVARVVEASTAHRPPAMEVGDMTDADLAGELRELMAEATVRLQRRETDKAHDLTPVAAIAGP